MEEEVEEVEEEEGLVGWMEGRSRDPFDKDFLPLHSQGWEESCSRLSLVRGSVSRHAYEDYSFEDEHPASEISVPSSIFVF